MIAILTFISTLAIGLAVNTDLYQTTIKAYTTEEKEMAEVIHELPSVQIQAEDSKKDLTLSDWDYDSDRGWFYELPEIDLEAGSF